MSKIIRQTATFRASPHAVYELLMDSRKHGALAGGEAKISRKVGRGFSISDGDMTGQNLELVPDEKIVQSWRYRNWTPGVYSTATFALAKVGTKTRLTFTQSGVPDEHYDEIKQGWIDYYWQPMKQLFDKG